MQKKDIWFYLLLLLLYNDSFFNDPRIPSSAQFPWMFPILENIGSFLFFRDWWKGLLLPLFWTADDIQIFPYSIFFIACNGLVRFTSHLLISWQPAGKLIPHLLAFEAEMGLGYMHCVNHSQDIGLFHWAKVSSFSVVNLKLNGKR